MEEDAAGSGRDLLKVSHIPVSDIHPLFKIGKKAALYLYTP
jgi:hypothetical protein